MASIVTARIGLELAIEALGTFKIADFLGNGAFGEVFRAINKETGAPVAVKLLPLAEFEDEQSKSALINEIKAAASITHPNIVQVLHVDEGKNTELGAEQNRQRTNQAQLYKTAWEELLAILDTVVNEFNAESDTPIEISNPLDSISQTVYKLPHGRPVACTVFPPIEKSISVRGGKIVGGGWIGVEGGRSANLVLLRNPSDLYGHWTLCEVSINALVDASKLLGRFGITEKTVLPMGFLWAEDFDEQIQYAVGGMHVFTYQFRDDLADFFTELLRDSVKGT